MTKLLALALALVAMPAQAQQFALHNGSLMVVEPYGQGRMNIRYSQPRPGLWEVGVRPGTLLINGRWANGALYATAFVFPPGCPPAPYPVKGVATPDGVLTLIGPAPLVDPYLCAILGVVWSANSTLVFLPQRSSQW